MTPYEMMLSESQERMLIILEEGKEKHAKEIFDKWDLDFNIIGKTTNTNKLTLKYQNKIKGEIPIDALATKAPISMIGNGRKKINEEKNKFKSLKKTSVKEA